MWNKLFASADLLQQGLDAAWLRNAVIRNNLANSETPGFKSSAVSFEADLARALGSSPGGLTQTHALHYPGRRASAGQAEPRVVQSGGTAMRMDGNNVDLEAENVALAQNSIQYNALLYKLNSELTRLSMAINEGR